MWTYSGVTMAGKIRGLRGYNLLKFVIPANCQQQPQLRLPECVQIRSYAYSSNKKPSSDGLMLNSSNCLRMTPYYYYYQMKGYVPLPCPNSFSYYSTQLHSDTSTTVTQAPPTPVLTVSDIGEDDELIDDPDSWGIDYNELEIRREIWEIGPGSTPTFNFAKYADDSATIQKLVQLGVAIHKWEKLENVPEMILKLDFQKDIEPYLRFYLDNGVNPDRLGYLLTLNPYILLQTIENMQVRVNYLESKKFTKKDIASILTGNAFWLLYSTMKIDRRLGFLQRTFELTGSQVRKLTCTHPRVVTHSLERIKEATFKIKDLMGFEPSEIVTIILAHPEILMQHPSQIWTRFDYLHNEVKFSHEYLTKSPNLLMTNTLKLKQRIGFLQKVGRAQFNPEKPNFVSSKDISEGEDNHFAVHIAKRTVLEFNEYLKTL